MKIAICSDSHDHIENINKFCDDIVTRDVDFLIHLGDFIARGFYDIFSLGIPCHFIRGNNDGEKVGIMRMIFSVDYATVANTVFDFKDIDGKQFFLSHYNDLAKPMAQSGLYDVVCYGHNHLRHEERIGNTLLLNPGAIQGNKESSSYCIYDTESDSVHFIEL